MWNVSSLYNRSWFLNWLDGDRLSLYRLIALLSIWVSANGDYLVNESFYRNSN